MKIGLDIKKKERDIKRLRKCIKKFINRNLKITLIMQMKNRS